MKPLTKKESEILLALFKDFTNDYNANSLSKVVNITPRGALKALKNLKALHLVTSKQLGRAVFYKVNLNDDYTMKLISMLLMDESREKAPRWLSEFKELSENTEIAIIFGSIIKNPQTAQDIDLLVVFEKNKYREISKVIDKRRSISIKAIHVVKQSTSDLIKNLRARDEVLLNIIKRGYIINGYENLVEVIRDVTRFP